jgi:hypothetical protein
MSHLVSAANHPDICREHEALAEFAAMPEPARHAVTDWIRAAVVPAKQAYKPHTSYGLKHHFEDREEGGFYLTNKQFKGAMLACGYKPIDENAINWSFRIKPAHPQPIGSSYPTKFSRHPSMAKATG